MALDRVRFEAKIDRSGDHHLWLGARSSSGSGQVRVDGKLLTAARAAYELEHGPVPTDVTGITIARSERRHEHSSQSGRQPIELSRTHENSRSTVARLRDHAGGRINFTASDRASAS